MKLMTLNTHSLIEKSYEQKTQTFIEAVLEEKPDIIALQEINQTQSAESMGTNPFVNETGVEVKSDNHAAKVLRGLADGGEEYFAAWLPIKTGYDKYDEGLAILSRKPIEETDELLISEVNDYGYWKTRMVLGVRVGGEWFYTVHMGWWNDEEEPFKAQWERLNKSLKGKGRVWLMGDFNSRADVAGEGYALIRNDGWHDSYLEAEKKDSGITVGGAIDGWRDKEEESMRIDYIFCNEKAEIAESKVIFNGINKKIVSDHYGIIIETK